MSRLNGKKRRRRTFAGAGEEAPAPHSTENPMSDSYPRRVFLKKSALTLGMAALYPIYGMSKAVAAPQTGKTPEQHMLIAYFSHTGNTALVAEQIHALTGGDMHRIRTVEIYPEEHDPCSELAGRQLRANYRPELAARVDGMEQYPVVFLGYPIWWHTMPMACRTFLESYDFSGKTLVPFCTHGGNGLADSPRDIAQSCPQATLVEGFAVRGSRAAKAQDDVLSWLQEKNFLTR